MKKLTLFSLGIFLLILITSCTEEPPTPAPFTVIAPTSNPDPGPYPAAPTEVLAYPAPGNGGVSIQSPTSVPLDSGPPPPTPDPMLGSAEGFFMRQTGDQVEPVPDAILYLARIILDSNGNETVASFNRTESPKTTTDADGRFIFTNIEPGRYGLVLDIVVESFLLSIPEDGGDLIASIETGQVFDLGELIYEDLPLPE